MPADPAATVHRYDEAWADADDQSRRRILVEIWTEDGLYVDPDIAEGVRGPTALAAFIGQSLEELPGLEITATSDLAAPPAAPAWQRRAFTTLHGGRRASGLPCDALKVGISRVGLARRAPHHGERVEDRAGHLLADETGPSAGRPEPRLVRR